MKQAMESVSCPICGLSFPSSKIQTHAEDCLDTSNRQQGDRNSKKPKLDLTTWGSLAPNSSHVFGKSPSANSKKGFRNVSPKVSSTKKNSDERKDELSTKSDHSSVNPAGGSFSSTHSKRKNLFAPLAEQMRPSDFENFVGQEQIMGQNAVLKKLLETRNIPSIILWGPPGCGKTTLAHIIASESKKEKDTRFVTLSATTAGVSDVKDVVQVAKNEQIMFKRKTILFIDEIHRFNKKQQDTFLPHVENGTIVLIGATTENPSFSLNSALLSRCRVIVLEKLTTEHTEQILNKALCHLNVTSVKGKEDLEDICNEQQTDRPAAFIEKDAVSLLANLSDGDARIALNSLQLAFQAKPSETDKPSLITVELIKDGLQKSHILYDRQGDEHYNCISALHKSMRGSDDTASLYWLARMLQGGEDPLYVARRMIRFASEDIGMADPMALTQAVAAYQGCHFIGMPECDVLLAQCAVYLSRAPKSIEVYGAYQKAKQCVDSHEGPLPGVPIHLRNAPTRLMKDLGYGKDYKYNPMYQVPVDQDYLPECLKGTNFFT